MEVKVFSEAFQKATESQIFLMELYSKYGVPSVAVVLGSGLGDSFPELKSEFECISYSKIPGFKPTSVLGHASEICYGKLTNGKKQTTVLFLKGRNHAYEGFSPAEVVHNVRAVAMSGVKNVLLTNAAGCLNTSWNIGDLMLITDHINLTGLNPISGSWGKGFSPQFVDLSSCYNKELQNHIIKIAKLQKVELRTGVYCGVLGPSYETPAEIKMMQMMGASSVGMSTVLETIACKQLGINVVGISCFTNYGAGMLHDKLSHHDVIETGKQAGNKIATLIRESIFEWPVSPI
jgi:inosine/guanosine/xanthosine phosphorylase family protein